MRLGRVVGVAALVLTACFDARSAGIAARTPTGRPGNSAPRAPAPPRSATAHRFQEALDASRRRFELHRAPWSGSLDRLVGAAPVSVSVAIDGRLRFSHLGRVRRPPASCEKLLLSMALLDRFGPRARIPTTAVVVDDTLRRDVVHGDLWLVGHGDPEVGEATIDRLASDLADTGLQRVDGSVLGDVSTFRRDRWAPGWHPIALSYVSVPTALTFDHNEDARGFVLHPERRAAAALTNDLETRGVEVRAPPGTGSMPDQVDTMARVRSAPLVAILRRQNTSSVNLDAEVLGKRLGEKATGRASIAAGARAVEAWARRHGARVTAHDTSGLSYANRIATDDMVRLLAWAERAPWGRALRSTLARPGTGTLGGRLAGVAVRAKTGTLIGGVSALSGWVRTRSGRRAAFSILSTGMSKDAAVALEDSVVRFLAERA